MFWVFHEVVVFKEFACVFVEDGGCPVHEELLGVAVGGGLLGHERALCWGLLHHGKHEILGDWSVRINGDFNIPAGLKTRKVFSWVAKIISSQFYQNKVFALSQFIRMGLYQLPALQGITLDHFWPDIGLYLNHVCFGLLLNHWITFDPIAF